MKIKDLAGYKPQEIDALLIRIPFFKELKSQGSAQLDILLAHSCIVELAPGETMMRRGDRGSWLYFLIKGRLGVYLDTAENSEALNYITPGELFGDLALLCNHERKATVAALPGDKKCLLFATDFKPFGELDDFTTIDLPTKLTFYRTMVHSIRWRLETNRMAQADHPLAMELRQVPMYRGVRGEEAELYSLFEQAQFLASVLDRWNSQGDVVENSMDQNAMIQDVMVAHQTKQ